MSKFVGDALVGGGPEPTSAPEVATVQMPKEDFDLLWAAANESGAEWVAYGVLEDAGKLRQILVSLRAQIGGSR